MQILISDDFDLQKIAQSGQCFRVKEFEDGTYRFITGTSVLYIKKVKPLTFEISCTLETWNTVWIPYFDLSRNYADIRRSIPAADGYMLRAAAEGQGIRILRQAPWEMLITFIISQRKSIPAIKSAVELLAARYGLAIVTPYESLHAFPDAAQFISIDDTSLAECRLGYRTAYVKDAVFKVNSGCLDLPRLSQCSDAELIRSFKQVYGVGDKIANCVALFAYGRTGIAPIDTWISRIIKKEYHGDNPFPFYGNAAGIMQQYAFYYAQSHKKETLK